MLKKSDLEVVFKRCPVINDEKGKPFGRGALQSSLEKLGFRKGELKKLARKGVLERISVEDPRPKRCLGARPIATAYVLKGAHVQGA
jgi:hypothetical protein